MYLVEDRVSKSKHLQLVSGVNPIVYWMANFSWDLVSYLFKFTFEYKICDGQVVESDNLMSKTH